MYSPPITVPGSAFLDNNLSSDAKLLLGFIIARTAHSFLLDIKMYAEVLNLTELQITSNLFDLLQFGYLSIQKDEDGNRTIEINIIQ